MTEFIESILTKLQEIFDPQVLGERFAQGIINLSVGVIVLGVFYLLWRLIWSILHPVLQRSHFDETAISFAEKIVKYGVLTIGVVSGLGAAGVNMAAVLASLGVAGLTIGFAARDALSNLISGLLIFLDRPFVIGDLVEIEGQYGQVDRITLRSTRVITSNGKMLAVPNTEVINKTVVSYTNFPHLRLDIGVTVAVYEDITRVRQALLDLVQGDEVYLSEPPPRVVITQLNDYNVALELQVWLKDERQHVEQRYTLRERVFEMLNEAGVDMPFETIQLTPLQVEMYNNGGNIA